MIEKSVCFAPMPLGDSKNVQVPKKHFRPIIVANIVDSLRGGVFWIALAVMGFAQSVAGQTIFPELPADTTGILLPYPIQYDNTALAESQVRYGLWVTSSLYLLDEHMVVYDQYEKIPAAFRLRETAGQMPIWGFRYWPNEELYSWVELKTVHGVEKYVAYVCNRRLEVVDTVEVSNPHEFYIMPDGLGYAYIGGDVYEQTQIAAPQLIWISLQHDTLAYWKANDPVWGIDWKLQTNSNCPLNPVDTFPNFIDYFHPNSIAAIKTDPNTLVMGLYNRNVDLEVELTYTLTNSKWAISHLRGNNQTSNAKALAEDSKWINTGHDIQYLFADDGEIVKSYWDNGGCRSIPNSGLKIFRQNESDTLVEVKNSLFGTISLSNGMGNGGVLLQNRYAASMDEIVNGPVYGNIGTPHELSAGDTNRMLLGVWTSDADLIFGIRQFSLFTTYRYYPYLENQLNMDDLRPTLNSSFSADSATVTLWLDSTQYRHIKWMDGESGTWSRTLTVQEYLGKEMIAYATNNPDWFWFGTHRYHPSISVKPADTLAYDLRVYPNPIKAGHEINLAASGSATVANIAGQVVAGCTTCNRLLLPESLSPGMYVVTVKNEIGATKRQKVLVY